MIRIGLIIGILCLVLSAPLRAEPTAVGPTAAGPSSAAPRFQTAAEADAKSTGCITCHTKSDAPTMHENKAIQLGCADCHGGNPNISRPASGGITFAPSQAPADGSAGHAPVLERSTDPAYQAAMDAAHVQPNNPEAWHWPASA